ncbi:MAG: RHS repeat-associated core domain-containing protein [Sulfurovum sp.]|nr:RHS repeat-associated core domain-containing protein [Sulfurovum sp.]
MTIGTETFITSYSYHNTLGRLTKEVQPSAAILEYEYDSVGNLLTFTLSNANNEVSTTQYQYDTLNRLKTVISPQGEPTNYSYDDLGNLKTLTHANGTQEIYSYDNLNRLTSLIHQDANANTLATFAYTLSPLGERVEIVEDNRSTHYNYDDLSRVISEEITDSKNGDYTSSYTYDEVSNTIASTIDGVTTQYDYDDNDRLLQQGGTIYTYDEQGNTLSQTLDYNVTDYSYNAKNQLIVVATDSDTITYSYNLKGIRTAKSKTDQTTQYIIDSNQAYAQVVQEIEDESLSVSYTYGHDLLSQTRQNKTYDYHYDGLGSARYLSDQNGTFTDSYNYEAFGKLLNSEGNTTNHYKFTGEQLDEETQNYYLRSRYFSPLRGGFTQQDSYMGNSQDPITLHKYLYANGNPVMNIDPSGYFSMMSVSGAMGIQNTLQNMQIGAYSNFTNVITGGWDGVSLDDIPALLGTVIGVGLAIRYLPKLFKKGCNSFDGTTKMYPKVKTNKIQFLIPPQDATSSNISLL